MGRCIIMLLCVMSSLTSLTVSKPLRTQSSKEEDIKDVQWSFGPALNVNNDDDAGDVNDDELSVNWLDSDEWEEDEDGDYYYDDDYYDEEEEEEDDGELPTDWFQLQQEDTQAPGHENQVNTMASTTSVSADFRPVALPGLFSAYDVISRDGAISLQELVLVTGARENVRQAFSESDTNGDGVIDKAEFLLAPWYRRTLPPHTQHTTLGN